MWWPSLENVAPEGHPLKYFLLVILLFSCGKKASKNVVQAQEQTDNIFFGSILPLNLSGADGVIKLSMVQDDFHVIVAMKDGGLVDHEQGMIMASRCPNPTDDRNQDGFVDSDEVFRNLGKILIPLDGELETQADGYHEKPFGNYRYEHRASYSRMLADLRNRDRDSFDDLVKLRLRDVPFHKLVLIVFGTSTSTILPSTVSKRDGRTQHASLPVACATLESSGIIPTEPDLNPEIPRVEFPESRPAPVPMPPSPEIPMRSTMRERIRNTWNRVWCRIRSCSSPGIISSPLS